MKAIQGLLCLFTMQLIRYHPATDTYELNFEGFPIFSAKDSLKYATAVLTISSCIVTGNSSVTSFAESALVQKAEFFWRTRGLRREAGKIVTAVKV